MISYLFPPIGGGGVQRALSLAKYLPQYGFDVHVLKARNAAGPVRDPGLVKQIPPSVRVHQAFTPELPFRLRQTIWKQISTKPRPVGDPARTAGTGRTWRSLLSEAVRRVLCPEPEVLWVPFAVRKAVGIIEQYGIEQVLVTAPPFSSFLVANFLKRKYPHLRLLSDFRDDWVGFYLRTFEFQKSSHTRKRAEQLERTTVELSDSVIAVTVSIRDQMRERYRDLPESKFVYIPNGYDPDAFAGFTPRPHGSPKIVVTHVGTVYGASTPRFYLDALDELPKGLRSRFETRFVGRIADEERPILESRQSCVRELGYVPQVEAIGKMEETDLWPPANPFLRSLPTGGEVERVLQTTGCGWCFDPTDRSGLRAFLLQLAERFPESAVSFKPDPPAIRRFERPRLVGEFAELMGANHREEVACN